MAKLALDKLKNNPKSQVLIVGSGISIKGFIINDFTVNGSNNIFIGHQAGKNEMGSNKLYISNSETTRNGQ